MAYSTNPLPNEFAVVARRRGNDRRRRCSAASASSQRQRTGGVWNDALIARLGPDEGEAALREPHVRAFDITGRPMRNWVAVEPEGVEDDDQLKGWIERATKFVRTLPKKGDRMRPIRFSCTDTLALLPAEIAGQILDLANWTDFTGYGVLPGIKSGGVRGPHARRRRHPHPGHEHGRVEPRRRDRRVGARPLACGST